MINDHLRFALMQHFSDRFCFVRDDSSSLSQLFAVVSPSISIYLKSCVISAGTSSCFRGVFWRQQGAGGKGSLSSLLRPHTKLTNSNSHGDHFWPIACKLPRRRIATDPTHAHTGGGECSTHERARAEREGGRFEEQLYGKEHRRVCAL